MGWCPNALCAVYGIGNPSEKNDGEEAGWRNHPSILSGGPAVWESAKRLGVTVTANPKEVDVVEAVMQATSGKGCDGVFETVGSPVTISVCFFVGKTGQRVDEALKWRS